MKKLPRVLVLVGPTASGKTSLSLELAKRVRGEIVSADARQIYKHLDIGTAKPTPEELQTVPHHFIDVLEPPEEYSAGGFGKDAQRVMKEILGRGRVPMIVGGSGLYVRAVVDGLFVGPGKDPELREILEHRLRTEGSAGFLETLRGVDPVTAASLDETKRRRIVRALEVYYSTGKPLSEHHREQRRAEEYDFLQIALEWPREKLYERINNRVDEMVSRGLKEEVEWLREKGYRTLNALTTVGYKEMFDHLDGKLSLEETVELIKRNTRRFAKRQLTWFRADERIRWVTIRNSTSQHALADEVSKIWA